MLGFDWVARVLREERERCDSVSAAGRSPRVSADWVRVDLSDGVAGQNQAKSAVLGWGRV